MQSTWVRTTRPGGEVAPWYAPTLWHAMSLRAWWRLLRAHSFRIALRKLPTALSVTAAACNNSLLGILQSLLFGARLRATRIEHQPLFVLGHWRSGTTHLHELLAMDTRFAFPSTYQCAAVHHCLLTGRLYPKLFDGLLPARRAMDDMAFGFERPQEDEVALVALGVPSPIWALGYPGSAPGQRFLDLRISDTERQQWSEVFMGLLRLLTYQHGSKPLLLKSPPHTARLALLAQLLPQARFVHIVRDPYAVFASSVNLWQQQQAGNALVDTADANLERFVLHTLTQMYSGFAAARASLPAGQFHQLRYEDLVARPLDTLQECYHALQLERFEPVRTRVAGYLAGVRDYRNNTYELAPAARQAVAQAWGDIYRPWGYDC